MFHQMMKNVVTYFFIFLSFSISNAEKAKEIKAHITRAKLEPDTPHSKSRMITSEQLKEHIELDKAPPHSKSERIITTPNYLSLLEDMKNEYNVTWTNIHNLNGRLNDHFRMLKKNRLSNAKRFAFLGASFTHPNICKCMLRVPCINQQVDKEPLTNEILEQFSLELDNNLEDYLKKFNSNIFRTIYLHGNKFVNPHQHQKRIFINSNPTFIYLHENVPANLICPRYPQPHVPVIWAVLVEGKYNPVYTGRNYVIEFPNHYNSGLLWCSFVTGKNRYEHTFILSFQNHEAETLQPTALLFPTTSSIFQTYSNASATTLFGPTTLIPIVPTTFATNPTKTHTTLAPTPKHTERYIEKLSTTTLSPTTTEQQISSTLSPAIVPQGQSESFILKQVENSVRGKILLLDIQFQRKLLNFLLSPSGAELSKMEIEDFIHTENKS